MSAIEVTRQENVATILLTRPDRRNALREEDWRALRDAVQDLEQDPPRCVLVRGAGDAFCAGYDLSDADPKQMDALRIIEDSVNPALQALRRLSVPTVAAVHGACVGGGLGIAMSCDIVLASEAARFGSPFRNIGFVADSGAHHFLRERLGHHKAAQLIFTGAMIDGDEAHRLGLICDVFADDALFPAADALAGQIASGPTAALAASKRILLADADYDETLQLEAVAQAASFRTDDASEGVLAFRQKRRPVFTGR